ncbi:MAG TPA: hypothetical protein VIJ26_14200 [Thermoanaerobaculia bacterium]
MDQLPAPDDMSWPQGITEEDTSYQGSRFPDVKAAIFSNPYQKVWGGPGEPPLPFYEVTNRSAYTGTLSGGKPSPFQLAAIRALDSAADLRWGKDGKGFRRFVRPQGVCVTGTWEITEDNPYTGYFKNGSRGLVIARISTGVTTALGGKRRSYGLVLKLFPTADENHQDLLRPANVILADDLGGTTASHVTEVEITNVPQLTGLNRGNEIPLLLREGQVFERVDRKPTIRQVYPIAELGKAPDEKTNAPEFMRLQTSPRQPRIDEDDVRNEVLAHIYDKGDPQPRRTLSFDLAVSDEGKRSGFAPYERQTVTGWKTIGKVSFNQGVASYNGDFVIHFRHPTWRKDRNDPSTATRMDGKKVG